MQEYIFVILSGRRFVTLRKNDRKYKDIPQKASFCAIIFENSLSSYVVYGDFISSVLLACSFCMQPCSCLLIVNFVNSVINIQWLSIFSEDELNLVHHISFVLIKKKEAGISMQCHVTSS